MSDSKIHQAIVAVMREVGAIGKGSTNEQQKYKYRSIEDVYNRVQPLFAAHGIFSHPKVINQVREVGKSRQGGELHYTILTVEYTFAAVDGSSIVVTVVGEGMDSGDKSSNKAMAAAHKYAICQVLNIPYQVIDPDAHTPDWTSALSGRVTQKDLNDLKRLCAEVYSEDFVDLDKLGKQSMFAQKVKAILGDNARLGGELDANDFRQWAAEEIEQCREALGKREE